MHLSIVFGQRRGKQDETLQSETTSVTPESLLAQLGDSSALENLRLHWDASMAAKPEGIPSFLEEAEWRRNKELCGFGHEWDEALARVAERTRNDEALLTLAWHCYWRTFLCPESCPANAWPEPHRQLGDDSGLFYLLTAFAFAPLMRAKHEEWGVEERITRQTAQQVRCYCDDMYRRGNNGKPGIYLSQLGWLRNYTRERYFRLGRLEYWLGPSPYPMEVYRHRQSRQVLALAPDGTHFAADGTIPRSSADHPDTAGWTATLTHDDTTVSGYLLDPHGVGTRRQVTLNLDEWDCVLRAGDPSLMMHIPSGGSMTPEACRESLLEAAEFFPRHFPDELPKAVVCASWIFSPILQEILPAQANLCVFQRNLFLFPVPSGGYDGLWFVYLRHAPLDPKTLPRDTSVQRAIADYLQTGRPWRLAGMFILLDDIPQFGQEIYLNPPAPQ